VGLSRCFNLPLNATEFLIVNILLGYIMDCITHTQLSKFLPVDRFYDHHTSRLFNGPVPPWRSLWPIFEGYAQLKIGCYYNEQAN
jgi:hypothetical protein